VASAAWATLGHVQRVKCLARAAMVAKEEAAESRSKQILDEAKNEEETLFDEKAAAAAAIARSSEKLVEMKAVAEAIVAELRAGKKVGVAEALESRGKSKPTGKLAKALRKASKTMSIIGEGFSLETDFLGGYDLNDPKYLSEQYRTGGCAAVCVRAEGCEGSIGTDTLSATIAEQDLAKGNFPSPLPVISRALVIDELQVAEAKADGAVGVVLPLAINGKEKTGELMAVAAELGLESLVRVCDAEQLSDAMVLEAAIVVIGDCTLPEALTMLESLPSGKAAPVSVADFDFLDVRGAWKIRDAGFNAMIAGRSMLDVCVRDRVPPTAILKAMNSKGSVKYGLGMQKGRLEGSKEFLGSIAM